MNGEPLNDEVQAYEAAMRPLSDWKFYADFPQRILNNLGRREINTDDLAMQAQLYWVVTRLLKEVDRQWAVFGTIKDLLALADDELNAIWFEGSHNDAHQHVRAALTQAGQEYLNKVR